MRWHYKSRLAGLALTCYLQVCANGATVYNEAVSGDLSNSGLSPTALTFSEGSNQVIGETGRGSSGTDRDYFTFTVPFGLALTAITPLSGTVSGGPVAFIGLQAGNQVTLPTSSMSAAGLLGWHHYSASDVGVNILNVMAIPAEGSSGFTPPLGSGSYSIWIQEFAAGTFPYQFDFTLAPAPSAIPEPATFVSVLCGVALLAAARRTRAKRTRI